MNDLGQEEKRAIVRVFIGIRAIGEFKETVPGQGHNIFLPFRIHINIE